MEHQDDRQEPRGLTTRPAPRLVAVRGEPTAVSPRWTAHQVEREVAGLVAAGDAAGAATFALKFHGADVFGFLLGVLDRGAPARDAYAAVGERVRREIAAGTRRCSLRVWMYALARQELRRYAARPAGTAPESTPPPVTLPEPTTTVPCRRTGLGDAIAVLRGRLPVEDRAILILHLDRGLDLEGLAFTELGPDAPLFAVAREAVRIRERLDRVRAELGRAALEHRLLGDR